MGRLIAFVALLVVSLSPHAGAVSLRHRARSAETPPSVDPLLINDPSKLSGPFTSVRSSTMPWNYRSFIDGWHPSRSPEPLIYRPVWEYEASAGTTSKDKSNADDEIWTGHPSSATIESPDFTLQLKSSLAPPKPKTFMGTELPLYPPRYYQFTVPSPPSPYADAMAVPPPEPRYANSQDASIGLPSDLPRNSYPFSNPLTQRDAGVPLMLGGY